MLVIRRKKLLERTLRASVYRIAGRRNVAGGIGRILLVVVGLGVVDRPVFFAGVVLLLLVVERLDDQGIELERRLIRRGIGPVGPIVDRVGLAIFYRRGRVFFFDAGAGLLLEREPRLRFGRSIAIRWPCP